MNILELLEREEGYRENPYHCSEGFVTIGIGTKIGPKNGSLDMYQFTVNKEAAYALLKQELFKAEIQLAKLDWYAGLDIDKQIIIQSMAYQLGLSGLLKFKHMITALDKGLFDLAAGEALDSKWARQVASRSRRHARVLAGESLDDVYKL